MSCQKRKEIEMKEIHTNEIAIIDEEQGSVDITPRVNKFKVRVSCPTFNHSRFIKEAMDGFCIQETAFPFVCSIFDDASSDGEQDILKEYLQEHFDLEDNLTTRIKETADYHLTFAQHKSNKNCFFLVVQLKYNHYSLGKSIMPYIEEWNNTKYIAICEGDDYWIDPKKLEKQVAFLEGHPDFTMVCNRTQLYSEKKKSLIGENFCYNEDQIVDAKDVIRRTGLFISSCSIVFLSSIQDNMPDYWQQCKVADYPLQIMCAMRGHVFYLNEIMSVYRVENLSSWMGQQQWGTVSLARMEVIKSQVKMFVGFSIDFPEYKKVFQNKIADHINRNCPCRVMSNGDMNDYLNYFAEEIKSYTLKWKIDLWIRSSRVNLLRRCYTDLFLGKYQQRKLLYSR